MRVRKGIHFLLHPVVFFGLAVFLIVVSGRYRTLWEEGKDPFSLVLGGMGGVVFYYGSMALTSRRLLGVGEYLQEVGKAFTMNRPSFRRLMVLGGRALYEEAFWRGTVQVLLGQGIIALFLTALLFTLRHLYLYHKNRVLLTTPVLVEFFLFSLVLGSIYLFASRIMLVVGIHLMRNLLVDMGCLLPERRLKKSSMINGCNKAIKRF